jgi:acyl-coenzyme A thioesterase 9
MMRPKRGLTTIIQPLRPLHCSAVSSQDHVLGSEAADGPGLYSNHSPIVGHLWEARRKSLAIAAAGNAPVFERNATGVLMKAPSDSSTSVRYNFSTDSSLVEEYSNTWGHIRMGRVFEDLDALAGTIAFEHCTDATNPEHIETPLHIITSSVDRVTITHRANLRDDMVLSGKILFAGHSAMQIAMQVTSDWNSSDPEYDGPEPEPWLTATFTFAALRNGKVAHINELVPHSQEEIDAFELASGAASQLSRSKTQQRKQARKKAKAKGKGKGGQAVEDLDGWAAPIVDKDTLTEALLSRARVAIDLPVLAASSKSVLMPLTELSNAEICHPQHRNTAGFVFGGFLIRRAFELAFATAYLFCGSPPLFVECEKVEFYRPVELGNLVRLKAKALYTSRTSHWEELQEKMETQVAAEAEAKIEGGEGGGKGSGDEEGGDSDGTGEGRGAAATGLELDAQQQRVDATTTTTALELDAPLVGGKCDKGGMTLVHIHVVSMVTEPELRQSAASNTFMFTFSVDHELPVVLPSTADEANEVAERYQEDVHWVAMEGWRKAKKNRRERAAVQGPWRSVRQAKRGGASE